MTEDEYIAQELNRVYAAHPDIALDDDTLTHYKACVFEEQDFDRGYERFARERDALYQTIERNWQEQQDALKSPHERAVGRAANAVAEHLQGRAEQTKPVQFDANGTAWSRR